MLTLNRTAVGLTRASTPFLLEPKTCMAGDKPGHDGVSAYTA